MADIVDDFLKRLSMHIPDAPADRIRALEREVRSEWGSQKVYVSNGKNKQRRESLADSLREGRPLRDAFAAAGVRQAQGYRLLKKPAR